MDKVLIKTIVFWSFVAVFIGSSFLNFKQCSDKHDHDKVDTVRVTIYDTTLVYKPVLVDSVVYKYEIVTLPVADAGVGSSAPDVAEKEAEKPTQKGTVLLADTDIESEPPNDSATVIIPITQKVYEDSTYKAYVSGYKPSLDSIFIYSSHEEVTIAKKSKPKRWGIGLHVGYGVIIQQRPEFYPYIGIGISYNLFTF